MKPGEIKIERGNKEWGIKVTGLAKPLKDWRNLSPILKEEVEALKNNMEELERLHDIEEKIDKAQQVWDRLGQLIFRSLGRAVVEDGIIPDEIEVRLKVIKEANQTAREVP